MRRSALLLVALCATVLLAAVAVAATTVTYPSSLSYTATHRSRAADTQAVANTFSVSRSNVRAPVLVNSATTLTVKLSAPVVGQALQLAAKCVVAGTRMTFESDPWFQDVFASTAAGLATQGSLLLSAASLSVAVGATEATVVFKAHATTPELVSCVFDYVSGDASFASASASIVLSVVVPDLFFSGVGSSGTVLLGSTTSLQVTSDTAPTTDTEFKVVCTDDQATPAQTFYVSLSAGAKVSSSFSYVAPSTIIAPRPKVFVTCRVTITDDPTKLALIDARFTRSEQLAACFDVVFGSVDVYVAPSCPTSPPTAGDHDATSFKPFPTTVLTATTTHFTVYTNGIVNADVAFIVNCVSSSTGSSVKTDYFAIPAGKSSVTYAFIAPDRAFIKGDANTVTCKLTVDSGSTDDARFAGKVLASGPKSFLVIEPTIQVQDFGGPIPTVFAYDSFTLAAYVSHAPPAGLGLTLKTSCVLNGAPLFVVSDAQFGSGKTSGGWMSFTPFSDPAAGGVATCTISYKATGDADFVAYKKVTGTFQFRVVRPTLTAAPTNNVLALTVATTTQVTLTTSVPVIGSLAGSAACTDSTGAAVAIDSAWSFIEGSVTSAAALTLTAPSVAGTVTCTFAPAPFPVDARFTNLVVGSLVFTVSDPLLSLSGVVAGAELKVGEVLPLTLQAGKPVPQGGKVDVDVSCAVTGSADAIAPATFTIDAAAADLSLSTLVSLQLPSLLASSTPASVTCTFAAAVATGVAAEWNGFVVPPVTFTVRPLTLTFSSPAAGSTSVIASAPVSFTVASELAVTGAVTLPLKCKVGAAVDAFTVPITILINTDSLSFDLSPQLLGAHVCELDGAIDASADARFAFATVLGLPLSFTVVAPKISVGGLESGVPVAVNAPVELTCSLSGGSTPNAPLTVPITIGGQEVVFEFPAGAGSCTQTYTPSTPGNGQGVQLGEVTGPSCYQGPQGATLDTTTATLTVNVVVPALTVAGINNNAALLTGSKSGSLSLNTNLPVSEATVYQLVCKNGAAAFQTYTFTIAADASTGTGTMPTTGGSTTTAVFIAPLTAVPSIVCTGAFVSGDARFNIALNQLTLSVSLPTVTVTHTGPLFIGSTSSLNIAINNAASSAGVKYAVSCNAGTLATGAQLSVAANSNSASLAYFAANTAGSVTCTLSFVAGSDERYTNALLSNTVSFTVVAASGNDGSADGSSASNNNGGAASSSSSTGANGGTNGGAGGAGGGAGNVLVGGNEGESSGSSGLSDGAKAAIAVGVILGVGFLAAAIFLISKGALAGAAAGAGGAASAGAAAPVGAAAV